MARRVFERQSNGSCKRRRTWPRRRGAIVVLFAMLLVVVLGVLALSVDTGYMYTMQGELRRAVDASALAGVGELHNGPEATRSRVIEYMVRNPVGAGSSIAVTDGALGSAMAQFASEHQSDLEVQLGHWRKDQTDPISGTLGFFEPSDESPSAVSVQMTQRDLPLFFAAALGQKSFDIQVQAIASYQPRDIMLVLDLSGSMNDDSELKSIDKLGRDYVEANLRQIYEELSSPRFGMMAFEPDYITVMGQEPTQSSMAQISVEYRYTSVYVKSTKQLDSVTLQGSSGSDQTFTNLSGTQGLFRRSDDRAIYGVQVESGTYTSTSTDTTGGTQFVAWENVTYTSMGGGMGGGGGGGGGSSQGSESFDFQPNSINTTIAKALQLDTVSYPYPSASWGDYFDYVKDSSGANANAGYRYKFGYLNLVNYWLEKKCRYDQTPILWMGSAQPITAVKNSVDQFTDYLEEVTNNDRAGLVVYNSTSGNGKLECELSTDVGHVSYVARRRQAGHYHDYTNIGAGMESARRELTDNGRSNAFKMLVVMTDGMANWKDGHYNQSAARQYVLDEAAAAAALGYPVMTISLGLQADTALMQQVADMSKGIHFNIPGGGTAAEYRVGLHEAFQEIAAHRPLRIVK